MWSIFKEAFAKKNIYGKNLTYAILEISDSIFIVPNYIFKILQKLRIIVILLFTIKSHASIEMK